MRLTVAMCVLLLASSDSGAANYEISVTRESANLYRIVGRESYVQTRYCYEYVYYEDSLLQMTGKSGRITFLDAGGKCDVAAVYNSVAMQAGNYEITVSREEDDWYSVWGEEFFIKTSACLSLALGEEAILRIQPPVGTLIFLEEDERCDVQGVFRSESL